MAGFIEADGHFGVRATIGQDITEESFKELQKELGQNLKRGLVKYSRVECR